MKKIIVIALTCCALTQTVSAQLDLNALKNQSDARARERKAESQQFLSNRNSKWSEFLNTRGEEWEKTIANSDVAWSGFLSDSAWTVFDDFLINEPPKKPKPVVAPDASKNPVSEPVKSEPIIVVPVQEDTAQATVPPVIVEPIKEEPKEEPKVEPKVEPKEEPIKEEPKVEPKEGPKEEPKDDKKPGGKISIGLGVVPGATTIPKVIAALPDVAPGTPPCKPIVAKPGSKQSDVNFYGRKVNLEYDPDLAIITENGISQKTIADFWKKASDSNYSLSVAALLDAKDEAALNDWSYYMLIKDFATGLYKDENLASLLTWFLLVRSGLDARVGIADNNVILLVPSETTLYGLSYLKIGGKNYYVVKKPNGGIKTYNADYSAANQFDFAQRKSPELGGTKVERTVSFKFDGQEYTFGFNYDQDLTKYYSDIPMAQYEIYFDAAPSTSLQESVVANLKPIVAGMDMPTAVNFLLRFVQLAFPYKTDPDQFGYEKYFYADEVFAYPYCDCEDRSVIYSYLVKNLLGKKVVGVEFPGHMATAVESTGLTMDGTRYSYKGEDYIIADPTYIRSSVGMCMPDYRGVSPKIHEIQ